jgi:hypothetical protein
MISMGQAPQRPACDRRDNEPLQCDGAGGSGHGIVGDVVPRAGKSRRFNADQKSSRRCARNPDIVPQHCCGAGLTRLQES